jgi:hypothetical protein
MDELRKNGRAETIRATGAVLIDSVLLYFSGTPEQLQHKPTRLIQQRLPRSRKKESRDVEHRG